MNTRIIRDLSELQPASTAARRWFDLFGVVAGLAAVGLLVAVAGLNIVPACMLVAAPVLLIRHLRQRKRAREAASRAQFGEYAPSFRGRR